MSISPRSPTAVRARAALVWTAVTLLAFLTGWWSLPQLRDPGTDFVALLLWTCSAAATVAAVGLWALATDVAREVLTDPTQQSSRRGSGPLRTLLLALCGVIALSAPAHAQPLAEPTVTISTGRQADAALLAGLRLPDRSTDTDVLRTDPAGPHAGRTTSDRSVVVQPGDCLWTIAESRLGQDASVAEIAAYWQQIYDLNRVAIGPDPDLIHPGLRLALPPAA